MEEAAHFLFFIRPRRFGKSLFLNNMMLGFSETEVRQIIRYYQSVGAIKQTEDAVEQIHRYAQDGRVRHYIRDTQLHLIVAQLRGYQWERVEEA